MFPIREQCSHNRWPSGSCSNPPGGSGCEHTGGAARVHRFVAGSTVRAALRQEGDAELPGGSAEVRDFRQVFARMTTSSASETYQRYRP